MDKLSAAAEKLLHLHTNSGTAQRLTCFKSLNVCRPFQVSNMFIMSLAIADLTVGAIVMPISAAYAITGKFLIVYPDPRDFIFKEDVLHYLVLHI